MSFSHIQTIGTNSAIAGGTTLKVKTNSIIPVNNVVVVSISSDNLAKSNTSSSNLTVTDSTGATYDKIKEFTTSHGAAADGVLVGLFYHKLTNQLNVASEITVTWSQSVVAKNISVDEFSVSTGFIGTKAAVKADWNSDPSSFSLTGFGSNSLFMAVVGHEGPNADSFTQSANYNNLGFVGTTGGVATSQMSLRTGYRLDVGNSGTETYDASYTNADHVQILGALYTA